MIIGAWAAEKCTVSFYKYDSWYCTDLFIKVNKKHLVIVPKLSWLHRGKFLLPWVFHGNPRKGVMRLCSGSYQCLYSERVSKNKCWELSLLKPLFSHLGPKGSGKQNQSILSLSLSLVCLLCYGWRYRDNLSLIFSLEATWVTNITEPQCTSVIGQIMGIILDGDAIARSRRDLSVVTKRMPSSNDTNRTSSDQLVRTAETEFKRTTLTRTACPHSPYPCT